MTVMEIIFFVYAFIFGLCFGSFLNVVILRGFSGESIVLPPSKCPHCKHKLAWFDNIPVLSFLILLGKCRYCKAKISFQYPVVELITGLMFLGLFYKFGLSLNFVFLAAAACLFIVMAVCDIKEKVIFDIHAYLLAILGLVYNFFNVAAENTTKIHFFPFGHTFTINQTFIYSVLGLIAGVVIMELLARIPKFFTGKRAFGEGDSYIAGALGAVFGLPNLIVILILSVFFQSLIVLPLYIYKLYKQKDFKLLSGLLLLFFMIILFKIGDYAGVFDSRAFYIFSAVLLVLIGLYCCKRILSSIKTDNNLIYLPFGPALLLAGIIIMFV